MGILNEMFDEENESAYDIPAGEFIAQGEYDSRADEILKGYKVYRKKYVYKSLVMWLALAALAMVYSILTIVESKGEDMLSIFCLLLSLFVCFWFINRHVSNGKKLKAGLGELEGTVYRAEFFTDKIKISTPYAELPEPEETEPAEQPDEGAKDVTEEEKIPASVVHLDQPIVTLIEKEDIFLLVVSKKYVFIIPKRGFADEDVAKIREKLSAIMGIRYKGM